MAFSLLFVLYFFHSCIMYFVLYVFMYAVLDLVSGFFLYVLLYLVIVCFLVMYSSSVISFVRCVWFNGFRYVCMSFFM